MQQEFVSLKVAAERKLPGVSKETNFQVDPRLIEVEPGFNRPIDAEHVAQFKASIRDGAIIPPIAVRVDAGRIILVDGEHRWRAVMALIADGVEIVSMAAVQFRGNDVERVAHLLTSSQGKPLTPLESGIQYNKLVGFGWDTRKIAARVGRSVTHVDQCLLLANSNNDVHEPIKRGDVSSSEAAKIVRKHGERAGAVIAGKLSEAKAAGKTRVTAGAKPKTTQELLALVKQIPDSVTGEWADKIRALIKEPA